MGKQQINTMSTAIEIWDENEQLGQEIYELRRQLEAKVELLSGNFEEAGHKDVADHIKKNNFEDPSDWNLYITDHHCND